jgi:hypothetical protein
MNVCSGAAVTASFLPGGKICRSRLSQKQAARLPHGNADYMKG